MFFGKIISQAQPFTFGPQTSQEVLGQVISLTNVVLAPTSNADTSIWIKKDKEQFLIASLSKANPQVTINVFISLLDEATILVKGKGVVHITGFADPEQGKELPFGEEEGEEEEEESEGEEELEEAEEAAPAKPLSVPAKLPAQPKITSPQQKPLAAATKGAVQPGAKKAVQPQQEEEEDQEDEDFDQQIEDDDDLDDDLDEDEEEEEQEAASPQKHLKSDTTPQQNKQQGGSQGQANGGKPNFKEGGKPNFNNKGNNFKNNNQGGNKQWQNKGGNNKNFQKGGKPFNKGGKNFQKH